MYFVNGALNKGTCHNEPATCAYDHVMKAGYGLDESA